MRIPGPAELAALGSVKRLLHSLGSTVDAQLIWSPSYGSYVVGVEYDPRIYPRIPRFIAGNAPPPYTFKPNPYAWDVPAYTGFAPYAMAIPVVMYQALPKAIGSRLRALGGPTIIRGYPRPSLTDGTGLNFPAVSFGGAPMIDGVAFANQAVTSCQLHNEPSLSWNAPGVRQIGMQPGCSCSLPVV